MIIDVHLVLHFLALRKGDMYSQAEKALNIMWTPQSHCVVKMSLHMTDVTL